MADMEALGDVDRAVIEADGLARALFAAAEVFIDLRKQLRGVFGLVEEEVEVAAGDFGAGPFIRAKRG